MNQFIIYRKSDGQIVRVITKTINYALSSLGYNPILYAATRVVSSKRIEPETHLIKNGVPETIVSSIKNTLLAKNSIKDSESIKVTLIGDSPLANTSFGLQYKILIDNLSKRGYQFAHIPYSEIPKIDAKSTDFFLVLSDYKSVIKLFENIPPNLIYWFALESAEWPDQWDENLKKIPYIVPISRYGERALALKNIKCLPNIGHAVDSEQFFVHSIRQRSFLRRENHVDNKFVISYVGLNVERKRLDLLLNTYALFLQESLEHKQSILFLRAPIQGYYNLPQLIKQHNLQDYVKVIDNFLPTSELVQLINLSDLGFSATSGEGFNIPILEYLMCGTPYLMGRHTIAHELLDRFPQIEIESISKDPELSWVRYNINPQDGVKLINSYFNDWKQSKLYDRYTLRAAASQYTTSNICDKWDTLFKTIEREVIENSMVDKVSSTLLDITKDIKQQQLYEDASSKIDGDTLDSVKWIKVF